MSFVLHKAGGMEDSVRAELTMNFEPGPLTIIRREVPTTQEV